MIVLTLFAILIVTGLIKYFLHMRHMESYVRKHSSHVKLILPWDTILQQLFAPRFFSLDHQVKHLPTMHPQLPFVGAAHFFIGKSTTELFSGIVKFINDNDTPAKAYIGPILNITLDKPEDIRTILMSSSCLDKPYMYRFLPSTVGILTTECKRI